MKVEVIKSFPGVIDGTTQTRTINVGEIIEGDLAKVALRNKWAKEHGAAAKPVPQQPTQTQPQQQQELPVKPIDIPADWKALKAADLKKLADAIAGKQVDPAAASKVVEEEVARRAAAQPKA